MSIQGCDISGWQPASVNFAGMQFVYVKYTQGTYKVNGNHDAQVAQARAEGLIVGHYHFPAWGNPQAEAQAFWAAINAQPGDFLVLDIEDSVYTPWPADPVTWCCAFEDELHRLSGCWAMDYAGPNVRRRWNWAPLAQRGGGLIDPEYNPVGPGSPAPWSDVAMWQNADTNVSGGDSDIFYGDRATLLKYGIPGGINTEGTITTPAAPATTPEDDDMPLIIAKAPGNDAIWIGNAVHRRHIPDSQTLAAYQWMATHGFYKVYADGAVQTIPAGIECLGEDISYTVDTFVQQLDHEDTNTVVAEVRANTAAQGDRVATAVKAITDNGSGAPFDVDAFVTKLKAEIPGAMLTALATKLSTTL
jgi:hypothetical protein